MTAVTLFLSSYKLLILFAVCDMTTTFPCNKNIGDCEAIRFVIYGQANKLGHPTTAYVF